MVYFMKVVTIRFICLTGKLKDCDICAGDHSQLKKKKKSKSLLLCPWKNKILQEKKGI